MIEMLTDHEAPQLSGAEGLLQQMRVNNRNPHVCVVDKHTTGDVLKSVNEASPHVHVHVNGQRDKEHPCATPLAFVTGIWAIQFL